MEERSVDSIKAYLQREDAQQRIRQSIEHARAEATVTIGRMAQLYHMKESRIRDLEARELLSPWRSRSKDVTGQRQYSPGELEKLAIIKELLDEGRYAPIDIPKNIDDIWKEIVSQDGQSSGLIQVREAQGGFVREADTMPIDQRVNHTYYRELFWRYYASHALYLSVMLIQEDVHFTRACLILPLRQKNAHLLVKQAGDLHKIGESLIGWLGQTHSFYTMLTHAPTFEYPSDFIVYPLQAEGEDEPTENTLLAIPRLDLVTREITLSAPVVEAVRRLLEPLYTEVQDWHFYLGQGMRDIVDPFIDFNSNTNTADTILTNLMQTTIRLGGMNAKGQPRWRFCCVLTPNDMRLPFQKRGLVVRARSRYAPAEYKTGTTLVTPDVEVISLNLRAYQSGRVIYRHHAIPGDQSIALYDLERPLGSAIAIPIGGEDDVPIGTLYVVGAEPDAFTKGDQHILRLVARMVHELLRCYYARMLTTQRFRALLRTPGNVDPTFNIFPTETDFIRDVESRLHAIRELKGLEPFARDDERQYTTKDALSFIAVDIDGQTGLADKYGGRMARNLSRAVGTRIQVLMSALFTNPWDCKLYHIYADRYYLLLDHISLEEARTKANRLKQELDGSYLVDAVRFSPEHPTPTENLLDSPEVTVRLGVGSYTYPKLQEVLGRFSAAEALSSTTTLITNALDHMLKVGQDVGGNVIVSWTYEKWEYRPYSLPPP